MEDRMTSNAILRHALGKMSSLFCGDSGVVRPHSAVCMPTHPRIQLKPKMTSVILQVPQGMGACKRASFEHPIIGSYTIFFNGLKSFVAYSGPDAAKHRHDRPSKMRWLRRQIRY